MSLYELDRPKLRRLIGWRQFIYVIAVLALSYAAFGLPLRSRYPLLPFREPTHLFFASFFGMLPGIAVLLFWGLVWMWKSRLIAFVTIIGLIASTYAVGSSMPGPSMAREASFRHQCKNNLKQIGLALHNYHDRYGTFPPAYVADDDGKPMHSWRVLILPFLDAMNIYDKYNFDEPWDGPANRQLVEYMPSVYRCPSHFGSRGHDKRSERFTTTYHAIVAPETMWTGKNGVAIDEITDGISDTLAVIELDQRESNWMDPNEITFDELQALYRRPWLEEEYAHTGGTHALLCDGSVRFHSWLTSPEYWHSLFTRAADDAMDQSQATSPERVAQWEAFQARSWKPHAQKYGAIGFLIAAMLPLPWVWIKPRTVRRGLDSSSSIG